MIETNSSEGFQNEDMPIFLAPIAAAGYAYWKKNQEENVGDKCEANTDGSAESEESTGKETTSATTSKESTNSDTSSTRANKGEEEQRLPAQTIDSGVTDTPASRFQTFWKQLEEQNEKWQERRRKEAEWEQRAIQIMLANERREKQMRQKSLSNESRPELKADEGKHGDLPFNVDTQEKNVDRLLKAQDLNAKKMPSGSIVTPTASSQKIKSGVVEMNSVVA